MREQNEPPDPNDTEPDWAENRVDTGAVRELMLLLVAYDQFNDSFQHYYGISPPHLQKQENRTVSIVRFGFFKVEEITMSAAAKDLTDTPLLAQYHPALRAQQGRTSRIRLIILALCGNSNEHSEIISLGKRSIKHHLQCWNCGNLHSDITSI
jgi:hypothetical protein